jgi:hypothetical protein
MRTRALRQGQPKSQGTVLAYTALFKPSSSKLG